MAKMVGMSRNIKLPWLNQMADYIADDLSEAEVKEKLNDYLSYELESPTVLRKTREILMSIWFYENDYSHKLRPEALELIKKYPEYALEVHWCMMMAAYPVFVDFCKCIGKMSEFQDEITLSQIKQKLFDKWGERTTLFHTIDKLISTLKNFDVLNCNKPGYYHIIQHTVNEKKIVSFMVYSIMNIEQNIGYTLQEMNTFTNLFPFTYKVEKENLLQDERFSLIKISGEILVSVKE